MINGIRIIFVFVFNKFVNTKQIKIAEQNNLWSVYISNELCLLCVRELDTIPEGLYRN